MSNRLQSFKSVEGKSKEGKRKLNNEVLLYNLLNVDSMASTHQKLGHWLEFRVSSSKVKLKRRDLKRYQKEARVLSKYLQGLRPKVIALELDVKRSFVNDSYTLYKSKRELFSQWLQGTSETPVRRAPLKLMDNESILDCIHQSLEALGIHQVTVAEIFRYLQTHLPSDQRVPSVTTIGLMLKKHFHLRFKTQPPAMVKYLDPTFNERRLWASRLLA